MRRTVKDLNRREVLSALSFLISGAAVAKSQMLGKAISISPDIPGVPISMQIVGGTSATNPFGGASAVKTGHPMLVTYGDGSSVDNTNSPNHNYPTSALYTLALNASDGWKGVSEFNFSGPQGSGTSAYTGPPAGASTPPPKYPVPMPSISAMVNLEKLQSCDTWWSGAYPDTDLGIFPNLAYLDLQGNSFSTPPQFSNNSKLTYCEMHFAFNGAVPLPDMSTCLNLSHFSVPENTFTTFPSFAACVKLASFSAALFVSTVTIPSFSACTLLETWGAGGDYVTGTVPDFSPCTLLTSWTLSPHACTDVTAGSFATQKNLASLSFYYGSLTSSAVNKVLADCVASLSLPGRVACTVSLHGHFNAAPTGQGITDKATLIAAGWTVTTD